MTEILEKVVNPSVIPTVKNPPERKRRRWRTLIALSFGYFVDQGENQAMSIFSPVLKSLWSLTNMNLAWITFIRSLLQSLSSPVWGFLSDRHSRKKVLLIGTGLWGIWTIIVGFTKTYEQLILIRVISGLGLGCLMPATFSIMADTFKPSIRGRMLGIMEAIGVLGMIVFTMGMGFLATPDMWRYGFFILGVASIISGFVIWFFVDEPVRGEAEPEMRGQITQEDAEKYKAKFADIKKVLKIPTIWVAIGQGLAGSMPWVVMGAFLILWLVEVRGVPTTSAPLVFGGVVIGTAISNILGGIIGDYAAKVNPKYGRAFIGQFSVFIGIPFTYFLFTKTQDWSMLQLAILCFVTALADQLAWKRCQGTNDARRCTSRITGNSFFYDHIY